jgi:hypothetical protein
MPEHLADWKLTLVAAATAAGVTDINSSSVNMAGYDAVTFFTTFGAITAGAVTSIKVQQSSDNGSVDTFADLTGTAITVADDDDGQMFGVEIIRPREQYLRLVVDRATQNAVVGEIYALQYRSRSKPISNTVANLATFESHAGPAEGTA